MQLHRIVRFVVQTLTLMAFILAFFWAAGWASENTPAWVVVLALFALGYFIATKELS